MDATQQLMAEARTRTEMEEDGIMSIDGSQIVASRPGLHGQNLHDSLLTGVQPSLRVREERRRNRRPS